jgi:hypothetical protein
MAAKNEEEQIRMDLIEAEAIDMRTKWSTLCYIADFVSNISTFSIFYVDHSYYFCYQLYRKK